MAVAAILTMVAWAADVSGTWEMSSPGRNGDMMTRDITITQDGNNIKVTMPPFREGMDPMVGEGTSGSSSARPSVAR